jgi:hypothetical protein
LTLPWQRRFTCYACNDHSLTSLEELGNHILDKHTKFNLILFFILSAVVIGSYVLSFSSQGISWRLLICIIVISIGFLICFLTYYLRNKGLKQLSLDAGGKHVSINVLKIMLWVLPLSALDEEKPKEEKTRIFSQIFGFLASLAITNALRIYYEEYLSRLSLDLSELVIQLPSKEIIPSIQLLDFLLLQYL